MTIIDHCGKNTEQLNKSESVEPAVLMITASHQTFSNQFKHLTGQAKFGHSNILYIIKGKVIEFLIEKPMSGQFSILIISTGRGHDITRSMTVSIINTKHDNPLQTTITSHTVPYFK